MTICLNTAKKHPSKKPAPHLGFFVCHSCCCCCVCLSVCLSASAPLRLRGRARHFEQAAVRGWHHHAPRVTSKLLLRMCKLTRFTKSALNYPFFPGLRRKPSEKLINVSQLFEFKGRTCNMKYAGLH